MKFGKISGVVFMAIAAVGIAAGTANAAPAVAQPAAAHNDATAGVDHGIHYRTSVTPASRVITATVDAGRFVAAADGSSIALKSGTGATLDQVALHGNLGGHAYTAAERISADGHTLTLTPKVGPKEIGRVENIDAVGNLINVVEQNALGVFIGASIGGTLGALLGFGILSIITAPIGAVIGAGIGGYAEGGQQFINAVQAAVAEG